MAGCGNHGCFIEEPKGQGTNGRCNCLRPLGRENEQIIKRKLHQLEFYRRRVEEMERFKYGKTISELSKEYRHTNIGRIVRNICYQESTSLQPGV